MSWIRLEYSGLWSILTEQVSAYIVQALFGLVQALFDAEEDVVVVGIAAFGGAEFLGVGF